MSSIPKPAPSTPSAPSPRSSRRASALSVPWILGGAAVLGLVAGVGLSFHPSVTLDDSVDRAAARAAASSPLGAPMWIPARRADAGDDPFAADPASIRGIPPFPNASPRAILLPPAVQGVPMAMSWFETDEPVEYIVRYYDEFFRLMNVTPMSHVFHEGLGYSGWLESPGPSDAGTLEDLMGEMGEGTMHMVSAIRNGDRTLVVLSASNPQAVLDAQAPQLPPGLALPPSATAPQVLELGETRGARLSVHALASGATLPDVAAFYQRSFAAGAWTVIERGGDEQRRLELTATRGEAAQTVTLTTVDKGVSVLIAAHGLESK